MKLKGYWRFKSKLDFSHDDRYITSIKISTALNVTMIALVPKAIKFYIASKASTMKPILSLLFALVASISYSQTLSPTWQWSKRIGSSGDNVGTISGNESVNDIKVDRNGNVYAVGNFFANTVFQNAQLFGQTTPLSFAKDDAYLLKYNSCGQLLWWRRIGGSDNDGATSLVLDNSGKIIVTGYSLSSPSFFSGGTVTYSTNMSVFTNFQFIAKFDTAGTLISVNTYPYDYTKKILSTSQGNLLITNGLHAAIINSLGVVTSTLAFILPTPFYPDISGIDLDRNNNIYLVGSFNSSINIGPGTSLLPTASTLVANWNCYNSLAMKFSINGTMQWYQRSFSNGGGDALSGLTLDTSETKLIVGGVAWNNSNVFSYNVNGNVGNSANAIYYLNSANGNLISGLTGSRNFQGLIVPIATDRDDNVHCIGSINGFLAFNSSTFTSTGQAQSCIGKLNPQGTFNNIFMLPQAGSGSGKEAPSSIAISQQGNVYVGGMFGGTLDSSGTAVNIIGGQEDGFVAKFGFPCGSTVSILSPLAPTSLTATYQGTLTNLINWVDNSNYETGFELWYNGPTPTFSLLTTLPPNTTSYTHTALNYNTTYCYAARAINAVGPSVFTNTDCATTPAMAAPQAPTSLVANNTGTLINTVNWVDNSFNETGFELWYHDASPTFSLLATLPANATSYTHTGLSYTTTYCYKALATNSLGPSVFTNTDCATTPQAPLPNAPTNLTALNTGTLVNTVNWVDNSNNETGFELWYNNASAATFSLLSTLPANITTYTHTGLSYTTTYCYKALATNSVGASVFTNTDCATTPAELIDETGIAKQSNNLQFSIYPNPSKGLFSISFAQGAKPITIIVTDAIGRVVKEEQFPSNANTSNFKFILSAPQGLYFAKITSTNDTYAEKLIIE